VGSLGGVEVLGIDIGGSGIKGAVVDVERGTLTTERRKILTPQPASPKAVAGVVAELVDFFSWEGPVGCTFPAVVRNGVVLSAANVDADWVGVHGGEIFAESIGRPVVLLNDADAAGIAEFRFGVARREGVVFVLTFGTGIGSAVFVEGHLMPNTEFGHIEFKGMHAEHYCAARVREAEGLTMKRWARRVDRYLTYLNELFGPDLIVIGGGVCRRFDEFSEWLSPGTEVVAAGLLNEAGIVGAALAAAGGASFS
jgi:polyphosphate glucokinase